MSTAKGIVKQIISAAIREHGVKNSEAVEGAVRKALGGFMEQLRTSMDNELKFMKMKRIGENMELNRLLELAGVNESVMKEVDITLRNNPKLRDHAKRIYKAAEKEAANQAADEGGHGFGKRLIMHHAKDLIAQEDGKDIQQALTYLVNQLVNKE
jgi:hypothetical protein